MTLALDDLGNAYVVCEGCGNQGPRRVNSILARKAAASAGWATRTPRGWGEDYCPKCRR